MLSPENTEKLRLINEELELLNQYLDTPEGKSKKGFMEAMPHFFELKRQENEIVPLKFTERQKLKFIKKTLVGLEDLEMLQLKSKEKYDEVRAKMQKKFVRMVEKYGKQRKN